MLLTPFEINLFQHLADFFARHGYELLADKKQFRKTTPIGFQNIILSSSFYGDETMLEVNFGFRNEQVEQIAQQFLHNLSDYRADANTVIISIGKYLDIPYFRYKINQTHSLEAVCSQIEAFFLADGFAFLNAKNLLGELDMLLNEHPNDVCKYVYNQTHRYYKGIIVASLYHNPHLNGLIDIYRHMMGRQTQNPYEIRQFERLISYLQHYSPN